jgi:hypothetical protein
MARNSVEKARKIRNTKESEEMGGQLGKLMVTSGRSRGIVEGLREERGRNGRYFG